MQKTILILAIALLAAAALVSRRSRSHHPETAATTESQPKDGARLAAVVERPIDSGNGTAPLRAPAPGATAAGEPLRDLDTIEAAIKAAPEDPMPHYRKCQALFAKGREQEAVDHAAVAFAKFKAADNELVGMGLGSITKDRYQIFVHYNMGPRERAEKKDGRVCPYSFRVWTTDNPPKFVRILDFELAYLDGELRSAAIGENIPQGRANLGDVDATSDFATVKSKVWEIITK